MNEGEEIRTNPQNLWDWYISAFIGLIGLYDRLNLSAPHPMSEEQKNIWRDHLKTFNERAK